MNWDEILDKYPTLLAIAPDDIGYNDDRWIRFHSILEDMVLNNRYENLLDMKSFTNACKEYPELLEHIKEYFKERN